MRPPESDRSSGLSLETPSLSIRPKDRSGTPPPAATDPAAASSHRMPSHAADPAPHASRRTPHTTTPARWRPTPAQPPSPNHSFRPTTRPFNTNPTQQTRQYPRHHRQRQTPLRIVNQRM